NTNDIVVGELVSALWDNFKKYPRFAIHSTDSQDVTIEKTTDVKMNQIYACNGDAHLLQNAYQDTNEFILQNLKQNSTLILLHAHLKVKIIKKTMTTKNACSFPFNTKFD
ncbi:hypothetical protein BpHYR1_029288, partial [Brachionus plicatilis]